MLDLPATEPVNTQAILAYKKPCTNTTNFLRFGAIQFCATDTTGVWGRPPIKVYSITAPGAEPAVDVKSYILRFRMQEILDCAVKEELAKQICTEALTHLFWKLCSRKHNFETINPQHKFTIEPYCGHCAQLASGIYRQCQRQAVREPYFNFHNLPTTLPDWTCECPEVPGYNEISHFCYICGSSNCHCAGIK